MPDPKRYQQIINAFRLKNVLVIGDLILDVFVKGSSTRLCPEAPVPVVDVVSRTPCIGGAGNTAANVRLLGADVTFCTVIGYDPAGDEAINLMKDFKNQDKSIFRNHLRETIVKTRIVAGTQVVTRFDSGTTTPIPVDISEAIAQFLKASYPSFDAIIISDYDKGVINDHLVDTILSLQRQHQKFLAIDSKRLTYFSRLRPSLVKPNYDEAAKLLQAEPRLTDRTIQMSNVSRNLKDLTGADIIALTLDSDGSLIIQDGNAVYSVGAPLVSSPQVSGAGDTYLAAFVLAYLSSNDASISADIATQAATLAIKKASTAACEVIELKCYFAMMARHIDDYNDLREICQSYHESKKRIVFTNGCFDILHSGHVAYLHQAKELGDVLIVGVNTDESIKRLKGPTRPINRLSDRLQVLSGMADIDHVVPFGNEYDSDRPINLIETIQPDVFVKGGDYRMADLPELSILQKIGTEVVILPRIPDKSTTDIINRIHQPSIAVNLLVP
jgi:D-beta-D-heptose 7-phosphate kinase / D-beta-D-heptose 1-phosphate adenosyltransferase